MTRLLLIGAGHAHALLIAAWRERPVAGVELVLVAPVVNAPYSGMIPGWLAGQYSFEQTVVPFESLCQSAGVQLIQAELIKLDPASSTVWLSDGQCLAYDWLSLNIGSTLEPPASASPMLAMRPLSSLKDRYQHYLAQWQTSADAKPLVLTTVGGGAAGVESLLCVLHRLRTLRPDRRVQAELITRTTTILPGFSRSAQRLALAALDRADVTVQLGTKWCDTVGHSSDLVIWATGAQSHAWQRDPDSRGELQTDPGGFIAVDNCLRSVSHPTIFAVGDCAALPEATPKAGVYAVRMGATLIDNVRRALTDQPLVAFKPQRRALALLNTADGGAIASWGPLGWKGRWVMHWKDRIDRRFIDQLNP